MLRAAPTSDRRSTADGRGRRSLAEQQTNQASAPAPRSSSPSPRSARKEGPSSRQHDIHLPTARITGGGGRCHDVLGPVAGKPKNETLRPAWPPAVPGAASSCCPNRSGTPWLPHAAARPADPASSQLKVTSLPSPTASFPFRTPQRARGRLASHGWPPPAKHVSRGPPHAQQRTCT